MSLQNCRPTFDERAGIYDSQTFLEKFEFTSQALADASWNRTGTKIIVNVDKQAVDWDGLRDGTNHAISHDLGFIVGDEWTLRFKFLLSSLTSPTADPNYVYIVLSDSDDTVASSVAQNFVTVYFQAEASPGLLQTIGNAGTAGYHVAADIVFTNNLYSAGTPIFVEIKRTSVTTWEISLYSDADFKNLIERQTSTNIDATVNGLRFLKIQNRTQSASNGVFQGTVDDIQFWIPSEDKFFIGDFDEAFGYTSQIEADIQWPSTDVSLIRVTPDKARLDFNWFNHSVSDITTHDLRKELGEDVSDTDWTLRCKATFTTVGLVTINAYVIGLYDSQGDSTVVQDWCMIFMSNVITLRAGDNVDLLDNTLASFASLTQPVVNVPVYWELKRINTTIVRLRQFRDANFTDLIDETTNVAPLPSSLANLRYIKCLNRNDIGAGPSVVGFIEDLRFWNGKVDPDLQQPNFEDNFANDATYNNISGTRVAYDSVNKELDWDSDGLGFGAYNQGGFIDPVNKILDGAKWTLRFKLDIKQFVEGTDNSANDFFVGLSDDNTSLPNVAQDYMGWRIAAQGSTSASKWAVQSIINAALTDSTLNILNTPTIEPVAGIFFLEFKRLGVTKFRATVYSDANYQTIVTTGTFDENSAVPILNATGLRFIKVLVASKDGTGNSTSTGSIDDIQLWDGEGRTVPRGDYQSDFARDMWTDNGTNISVSTLQKRLNFNNSGVGGDASALDLVNGTVGGIENTFGVGVLSQALGVDDKWKLRFRTQFTNLTINTNNDIQLLGLSDSNQTLSAVTVGDGLYVNIQHQGGAGSRLRLISLNGGSAVNEAFQLFDWQVGVDYFFELERLSETEVALRMYSDVNYSIPIIELFSATIPVGVTGLQFIKSGNRGGSNGDIDGFITDIQFILNPAQADQRFNTIREVPADWTVTKSKSPNSPIAPLTTVTPTLALSQKNTLYDDFTQYILQADADSFWPSTDNTRLRALVSPTLAIDADASLGGALNINMPRDLGFIASNDKWTLRCKVSHVLVTLGVDTTANDIFFGLSNISGGSWQAAQNFIGTRISVNAVNAHYRLSAGFAEPDLVGSGFGFGPNPIATNDVFYLEIKRISATVAIGSIYSDVRFRNLVGSFVQTGMTAAATDGLQFIKAGVFNRDGTANSSNEALIDEIQFWDGETDVNYQEGRLSSHLLPSGAESSYIFADPLKNVIRAIPVRQPTDVMSASINVQNLLSATPPQDVDQNNWTLRFAVKTNSFFNGTGSQNLLGIVLSNGSARLNYLTAQDWLGLGIDVNPTNIQYRLIVGNNTDLQSAQVLVFANVFPTVGVTHYFECVRFDETNFRINIYADAEYTQLLETQIFRSVSTLITGLEFFRLVAIESTIQDSLMDVDVFDVQLFDGLPNEVQTGKVTDKTGLFTNRGGLV